VTIAHFDIGELSVPPLSPSRVVEESPRKEWRILEFAVEEATGIDDAPTFTDLVDEWGRQSFPASDPPANW
jgi:hypothetical protein